MGTIIGMGKKRGISEAWSIFIAEYSPQEKKLIGYPKRIWEGGTTRGCIEAPHLYKHNGKYYIMCAEGGTGYHNYTSIGRADSILGPYEKSYCLIR